MNGLYAPLLPNPAFGVINFNFQIKIKPGNSRRTQFGRSIITSRSLGQSSIVYSSLNGYKLRQITPSDVPEIASLCLQTFGNREGARFKTTEQWDRQISFAVNSKLTAQREARIDRILAESQSQREQLSTLEGSTRRRPSSIKSSDNRRSRQLRYRSFFCCIAEEVQTSQIVGCVALTLARPEAALPPPFPTSASVRCYVSNMAVDPEHRRQGVASEMLRKCERVARLWGRDSIWLHVDEGNTPAESLYSSLGYQRMPWGGGKFPWVPFGQRQRLMMKQLPPPMRAIGNGANSSSGGRNRSSSVNSEVVLGSKGENGVFVWGMEKDEDGELQGQREV